MSGTLKFRKVNSMPGIPERNALYFVQNGHTAETYLTSAGGLVKAVGNTNLIQDISTAVATNIGLEFNLVSVVDTIEKRDFMRPRRNTITLVKDATQDPSVKAGSALYLYSVTDRAWIKIAEFDALNMVFEWANVSGKPNSSPAQIDSAVDQAHTHYNHAVLNELTENNGKLIFKGREDGTLPSDIGFDGGHF